MKSTVFFVDLVLMDLVRKVHMESTNMDMALINVSIVVRLHQDRVQKVHTVNTRSNMKLQALSPIMIGLATILGEKDGFCRTDYNKRCNRFRAPKKISATCDTKGICMEHGPDRKII